MKLQLWITGKAPASHLLGIDDEAVDAVMLRSVLIYEPDKATAFAEFYRDGHAEHRREPAVAYPG